MIRLNKAIFFDRDGVINDNSLYYTYKTADVVFNDGIFEAMKLFQDNDYLIFIVTNQSGIAKCVYTHNDVLEVHQFMSDEFKKRNIAIIFTTARTFVNRVNVSAVSPIACYWKKLLRGIRLIRIVLILLVIWKQT